MKKCIKCFCGVLSFFAVVIFTFVALGQMYLPGKMSAVRNEDTEMVFYKVYSVSVKAEKALSVSNLAVNSDKNETEQSDVKLFGVVPVEKIDVIKSDRKYVKVGGDIIGIRLYTDGIMVIGTDEVETEFGNVNPGEECGLEIGDMIAEVNSKKIKSVGELNEIISGSDGSDLKLRVKRGNNYLNITIKPQYSQEDSKYRCGLWLRDSTAGIGTLTFCDDETGMYASLGHGICDQDTEKIMPVGGGDILNAVIQGYTKGEKGAAGQIKGSFGASVLGNLYENNDCGVYGRFSENAVFTGDIVPVAMISEVKTGKAEIITSIDENGPQYYDIEIEKITYSETSLSRNLTIRITDEKLLNTTGGIIQGMSGSPIIQNGMLVGAVTHVFINDPAMGYGILADTMVDIETDLSKQSDLKKAG